MRVLCDVCSLLRPPPLVPVHYHQQAHQEEEARAVDLGHLHRLDLQKTVRMWLRSGFKQEVIHRQCEFLKIALFLKCLQTFLGHRVAS